MGQATSANLPSLPTFAKENLLKSKSLIVISAVSVFILLFLTAATWDMNFWPTDAEVYYLPAAQKIPSLKYLSQIHTTLDEERVKWLHGKELFVWTIAGMEKLFNDFSTLRPAVLVGTLSVVLSSVFIFLIARLLWGAAAGWLMYILFTTSFWPYLYVLFVKHQTQGLVFFLSALFLLLSRPQNLLFAFLAGLSMGFSFYSSTVSVLYLPYICAGFVWAEFKNFKTFKDAAVSIVKHGLIFVAGFLAILLWVNYPDVVQNFNGFLDYVTISSQYNHFFYNQKTLHQWIPVYDIAATRGGWWWVIKYFMLVMPVLCVGYVVSTGYLLRNYFTGKTKNFSGCILFFSVVILSFTTPMLAEARRVAQYGANYFPSLIGVLMLMAYALAKFLKSARWQNVSANGRKKWTRVVTFLVAVHVVYNFYVFFFDVYPTRMATTFLARKLDELNVKELATYRLHPLRRNIVDVLPQNILSGIQWIPMDTLLNASARYALVPPVSKDNIYLATGDYTDFDDDPVLNQIVRRGNLRDYALASFKTLASSLIWSQEEEVLAYRYLILNQFPRNLDKTKVWILDAAKIQNDKQNFLPNADDIFVLKNNIRNIGTENQIYMFKGKKGTVGRPTTISGLAVRVYQVGGPHDELVAYLYRIDPTQPLWIAYRGEFASSPVASQEVSSNPQGGVVRFQFKNPVALEAGPYFVAIYRTGPPDDQNFYRIYEDFVGRMEMN